MALSRFHDHPDFAAFALDNQIALRVLAGSALKYGLLAAGHVVVSPRLVVSSVWDTATGPAILEAIGSGVVDWHTGLPPRYGMCGRRNPRLLAFRAPYQFQCFVLRTYEPTLL